MNSNTGKMAELNAELIKELKAKGPDECVSRSIFPNSPPTKRKDVVEIAVGEVVDLKGVSARVVHINTGKRRVTLEMIGNLREADENPSKPVGP